MTANMFGSFDAVNECLSDLYTKLMSGKEKHYVIKEAANVIGKVIGNHKNKLLYHAMRKNTPEISFYEQRPAAISHPKPVGRD